MIMAAGTGAGACEATGAEDARLTRGRVRRDVAFDFDVEAFDLSSDASWSAP
jgi:hypothetical protein